jgi:hypothetical protein
MLLPISVAVSFGSAVQTVTAFLACNSIVAPSAIIKECSLPAILSQTANMCPFDGRALLHVPSCCSPGSSTVYGRGLGWICNARSSLRKPCTIVGIVQDIVNW